MTDPGRDFKKGAVSWCQRRLWHRIGPVWWRWLAASWQPGFDDRPMSDHAEFYDIYDASRIWRRFLRRRWARVPDIDAEIDAAMWEHYHAGVTEQRALFDAVSATVRRYVRREQRAWDAQRLHAALSDSDGSDRPVAEEVVERLAAESILSAIEIPDRVVPMLARRLGHGTEEIPRRDRMYVSRWSRQMRAVFAHA